MFLKQPFRKLLYKSLTCIICALREATSLLVQCGIKRDVCAAAAMGRDMFFFSEKSGNIKFTARPTAFGKSFITDSRQSPFNRWL